MAETRTKPHEFFTLWDVDPEAKTIRLKKPPAPQTRTLFLTASSSAALYVISPGRSWLESMKEARGWLESKFAKREDWFADDA